MAKNEVFPEFCRRAVAIAAAGAGFTAALGEQSEQKITAGVIAAATMGARLDSAVFVLPLVLLALPARSRAIAMAVIAALHDLTLAARFCDRILVLAGGAVVRDDAPAAAFAGGLIENHWNVAPEFLKARDGGLVVVPHAMA